MRQVRDVLPPSPYSPLQPAVAPNIIASYVATAKRHRGASKPDTTTKGSHVSSPPHHAAARPIHPAGKPPKFVKPSSIRPHPFACRF